MVCKKCEKPSISMVKSVAPEDLAPGMFVCALAATAQCWPDTDCIPEGSTVRAVRMVFAPADGGVPVKITSVCLPFALVETHEGRAAVIDTRSLRLAQMKKKHAKRVFAALARNKALEGAGAAPGDSTSC